MTCRYSPAAIGLSARRMARAVSSWASLRLIQESGHAEEAVELTGVLDERGGHLRLGELVRVLDPFVA